MSLSAGTISDGTWSVSIGPLPPGILSYTIMAIDTLGQGPGTPLQEQLTINMPPPPVVSTPTFTPAAPTDTDPITVQVSVTSSVGVAAVDLNYLAPGAGQWSQAPMSLSAGDVTNGTWSATIGSFPQGMLSYTVMATDTQGQWTPSWSPGQLPINMPPPTMPPPPVVSTPTFTPPAPTDVDLLTVQAGVTSAIGVGSVILSYQAPGTSQWSQAPMSLSAGDVTNGTWSVTIGPLPAGISRITSWPGITRVNRHR